MLGFYFLKIRKKNWFLLGMIGTKHAVNIRLTKQ